ncbi:MAG: 5,10-methylenetetrahydrofolate reductase [Syntrophobacterales bacterium CG_4_8_14_3_um_filter_58_8]|nr:MAG: 5,10-methylenetetrahydrofolate reductase [Syntrophaceae bacterium CG2_30_58_14]PIV05872.1 MAG: 5,10-methylenetetrahydrofolate reductase [Syntrophobacterales bacterium CG03_land_8_20_14_0_80_58_14]PJC74944.1 MAG: 5,10-methylenetetrahydrofolate reductase [Syntrophobacterales bacterium CG_4_8_14_3_um_filter_58_8]
MKSGSNLEKVFVNGHFAVTAELGPPKNNDVSVIQRKVDFLRGYVDAVNITDNQTAIVRMSSIATSAFVIQMGMEPVMQMVTRDRNRIAMQSDLFGATALGIKNIVCLTGDHHTFGNQVNAKNVHDLDSVQLINLVKTMRDEKTLMGGEEKFEGDIKLFIGGAANPFADPFEFRALRTAKKAAAGVDFIQTQCIYDMERFKEWMKMIRDLGVHEKVHIMAGITPLKSAGMARYMAKNVAGITIPDAIIDRMAKAAKGSEEGIKICVEQIQEVREIEGVHGVHIMAIEWEQMISKITEMAGLLPRPKVE